MDFTVTCKINTENVLNKVKCEIRGFLANLSIVCTSREKISSEENFEKQDT